ncbi:MAG TPA: TIGR01777 family oxidoreductase [Solirubrobacteraceae bacterium]|jgi:uncharacterized protein (TIGR01777 family)|nr:TIGR01777 family oxidoreductase [Solirubrobacteraceae bacterium]
MCAMRVTVTGATGLIGPQLVAELRERGAQVTVLTRDPARARAALGEVEAVAWELLGEPAPARALAGRDAVIHLAGEPVAQRWSARAKQAIRDSRVIGTRNLVDGLTRAHEAQDDQPPRTLIGSSAIGYYGAHGEEPLDEDAPPGGDFLSRVCVEWEDAAAAARELGTRVVHVRTGVVLDRAGGALAKMLPAFRLGVGGPVAGGDQYVSWIHAQDVVGMMLAALEDERWSGPVNATAPEPVRNRDFSRALGRVLGRPSLLPVPGFALHALYGEMAEIVTTGARVLPAKPLVLGYQFAHPQLEQALRRVLAPAPAVSRSR